MNLYVFFLLKSAVVFNIVTIVNGFNLVILHTNDIHAHLEQMNKYTSACKHDDVVKGLCYGGIARRVTKVREINSTNDNVVLLDAGDQFQGSLWFNIFKGREASLFMNELHYDAMTFGNHEFDNGVAGLVPFLKNLTFPVTTCNLDASREPRLQGKFQQHVVLTKSGQKIGIIGYITEDTSSISNPGDTVSFKPVVEAVRKEVAALKRKGVKIIIGVGHYGYGRDKKLAAAVDGLDVLVGGHTHSFLYTGKQPSNEQPEGPYPTIITQSNGRKVLVVQTFWAGKYLGFLNVTFNSDGDVDSWNGEPILLDNSTAQDPAIERILDTMKPAVEKEKNKIVGYSAVYLEGDNKVCRLHECNLGNLITDGMVTFHASRYSQNDSWTDKPIAILNSGGIRSPIGQGNISKGDVLTTMPFGNMVDVITIKGKYIRAAFEHSVEFYDPIDRPGAFLQVSGIHVTYNLCNDPGSRVVSISTRCGDCWIPRYQLLDDEKIYRVIALNFVIKGGDGYTVIKNNLIHHTEFNSLDSNVFIKYLKSNRPITKGVEGRITIQNDCINSSCTTSLSLLLIVCASLMNIIGKCS